MCGLQDAQYQPPSSSLLLLSYAQSAAYQRLFHPIPAILHPTQVKLLRIHNSLLYHHYAIHTTNSNISFYNIYSSRFTVLPFLLSLFSLFSVSASTSTCHKNKQHNIKKLPPRPPTAYNYYNHERLALRSIDRIDRRTIKSVQQYYYNNTIQSI